MNVCGPVELYPQLLGEKIGAEDITDSIKQATRVSDYQFITAISPLVRTDGTVSYLTPEEVGSTAKMIEEVTGSKKHPYKLSLCNLSNLNNERLREVNPLEPAAILFKYRTAARRFMVMAEIEK